MVLFIDNLNVGPYLRNTLLTDKLQGPDEAVMEIYRRLRPGDQPALDSAQTLFQNLFFNPRALRPVAGSAGSSSTTSSRSTRRSRPRSLTKRDNPRDRPAT